MPPGTRPRLTIVEEPAVEDRPEGRDLDWSILMARAQAGDAAAYRRLLEEITPYLRSIVARQHRDLFDVEDSVQDILLTIHAVRASYDPSRPFGPWLVAIAKRRSVDHLRRRTRRQARETRLTEAHDGVPAARQSPDSLEIRELSAAIDTLPESQKQAIRLMKLQELSLDEAAAMTSLSVGALKVATHRAIKSLHAKLTRRSPR
jgi:RNA polymerase sigma-70 factor, ECF subfamily